MRFQTFVSVAAIVMVALSAQGRVRPASMITSDMVLQQNADARIWGTADPGSTVTVTPSWDGKAYTTVTDRTGEWCVAVRTPAASFTPYTITISDGEPLTLDNILVGEVWLASGQSNMQMPLKGYPGCCVEGGFDEVASSRNEAGRIRFFTVPLLQSYTPLDTVPARWTVPSPETAPEYSALCWHLARRMADVLDVPVGIVSAAYGGAKVESWLPREILETYPDISLDPKDIEPMVHYLRPMLAYNAMFNPIRNYTYRGILWYQGCSNVSTWQTYASRLATMVKDWRDNIGLGDIPFYAVEIAPYEYDQPDEAGRSPLLRQAQWDALKMIPNSGMISTNDLVAPYERHNIHPADKASVGKRLCDLVLNRTYGCRQFPVESPRYRSHRIEGREAWVAIDSPADGVCRNYDIRGFEIAGADKVFHPADARFVWQTNEIVLTSPEVDAPVAVRYGWRDFLPGTLHAANYLPLVPFRTDDWE